MQVNFPKTVDHTRFMLIDEIIAEAKEIAKSPKLGRTESEVFDDSMNGLTVQYAVAYELSEAGYDVRIAPRQDKSFDFEIDGVRYDIKGTFYGQNFGQSAWEKANALPSTIYPCYDCRGVLPEYVGWAKHSDFWLSNFNEDYYVPIYKLHK